MSSRRLLFPVNSVPGAKPVARLTIDSTKVKADQLKTLEDKIYGTAETEASLPLPDDVIAMFPKTEG